MTLSKGRNFVNVEFWGHEFWGHECWVHHTQFPASVPMNYVWCPRNSCNRVGGKRRDVLTCPLFGTVSSELFGTLHEGVTSVGSSRQRLQGGLVHLVNGCRGDPEFGGDRGDRVLGDLEVYPTVGGEVWADVALVVSLNFITGQPAEERGDVVDGQLGLFGDREKGSLVGPHQRLQRRVVERDTSGVHGDSYGGDLEVVADPGQDRKALLAGDLFGR